jgi:anti-sigma regulatory factor (Ser/Thr protein kinase)
MTDGGRHPARDSGPLLREPFTGASISELRHTLSAAVAGAGLTGAPAEDFVLAVHELVANAVQHGGGAGILLLRRLDDVLTCEVADRGGEADGLPVRLSPADQPGGRGLWLAHHLTGTLVLTRGPSGVTASVSVCLGEETSGGVSSGPAADRRIGEKAP